jgi:hypothetical protein
MDWQEVEGGKHSPTRGREDADVQLETDLQVSLPGDGRVP